MADEKSTIMADETDEQIADGLTGDTAGWTLDELIAKMCPDGVEWKKLEEVATIKHGRDYKHLDFGNVPVWGSGGYMGINVAQCSYDKPTVLIPRKGSLSNIFYLEEPFWNVDTVFYTVINENLVTPRYFYHVIANAHVEQYNKSSARPSLTQEILNRILVPVPPIEVQVRIAHILDLLSELTSELTSEREARQSQYEWYRNHLLDKDTLTGGEGGGWQSLADLIEAQCPEGVEYRPITELVRLNAHKQLGASALEALVSDDGNIPLLPSSKNYDWMTTEELAGDAICEGNVIAMGRARYANMKYCSGKFVSANNVLIESIDENVLDARFLYHFLSTHSADCYSESGTYPKFDRILFEKLQVPVPPLDVQLLIVDLLDKLDDYAIKINGALPREIVASQQRYEWWRDRLLDFRDVRGGGIAKLD